MMSTQAAISATLQPAFPIDIGPIIVQAVARQDLQVAALVQKAFHAHAQASLALMTKQHPGMDYQIMVSAQQYFNDGIGERTCVGWAMNDNFYCTLKKYLSKEEMPPPCRLHPILDQLYGLHIIDPEMLSIYQTYQRVILVNSLEEALKRGDSKSAFALIESPSDKFLLQKRFKGELGRITVERLLKANLQLGQEILAKLGVALLAKSEEAKK
ncbi:MAG: hypothetical protein ACHQT8_06000 [Chlamydiales bacterium]